MKRKQKRGPNDRGARPSTPGAPKPPAAPAPRLSAAWRRTVVAAGLALAAIAAYLVACLPGTAYFSMDDASYVFANPRMQSGLTSENVAWSFTTLYYYNWHPLTWLSYLADFELYGLNPEGYRFTNVLWHAANAVLLLLVLERLTRRFWPSALAAALFALHPVRVESVAWISERKDVLSGFFWIATMGLYGWYAERPTWARYMLTAAAFALGLMSKAMLVTLPCVLLLLDGWPLRRWPRSPANPTGQPAARLLLEKAPFFLMAAATACLTALAQGVHSTSEELGDTTLLQRVLSSAVAYVGYLWETVWPVGLAPLYTRPTADQPLWSGAAALLFLAGLSAVLLWLGRRRPYLTVGWLWFLGTLVPVIGLVPVGIQTMADRYLYIPQIGLLMLLVWAAADAAAGRVSERMQAFVAGATLLALGVLTLQQAILWRDPEALWRHAVAVTQDNFGAHDLLGQEAAARGALDEAIAEYRRALKLQPDFARANLHLGLALRQQGDWAGAADCFRKALARIPELAEAQAGLGHCLMQLGRMEEALPCLATVVSKAPNSAYAHFNLATALLHRRRTEEAEQAARAALRLKADLAEAHVLLGTIRALEGKAAEAEAEFRAAEAQAPSAGGAFGLAWALQAQGKNEAAEQRRRAVQQHPLWGRQCAEAAWALATHPDPTRRNGALALFRAQTARLASGGEPRTLEAMAAAYAELGCFPEAVAAAQEALAACSGPGASADEARRIPAIQARLKRYGQGQPWREPAAPP